VRNRVAAPVYEMRDAAECIIHIRLSEEGPPGSRLEFFKDGRVLSAPRDSSRASERLFLSRSLPFTREFATTID